MRILFVPLGGLVTSRLLWCCAMDIVRPRTEVLSNAQAQTFGGMGYL